MSRKTILILLVNLLLASAVSADNLYRVKLQDAVDAAELHVLNVDVVFQGTNEYLVLVTPEVEGSLQATGLDIDLVARDVNRTSLAIDGRLDRANVGRYPLLFEKDNFRLYRMDGEQLRTLPDSTRLFGIGPVSPVIKYVPERSALRAPQQPSELELDSLIAKIDRDSLRSYTETLQAFYRRTAGTLTNYQSRDWIADKFRSFGYDSVEIDSFQAVLYSTPDECQNVIAYKIGTVCPECQIVVGAHRDAVSASPGADDNGSGTAGVLEMARALKDVPTDMTFIFVLFDAEEFGLYGSWHYAEEAAARGDHIVYMFNMDMLGYYENTNYATLYYGADDTFSRLWQTLAQSLVGVTGVLSGASSGSDHYPFTQYGYDATFVIEYDFSSVYHSSRDSTTYMDFDYVTKLVRASLAATYTVDQTEGPVPGVAFSYPDNLPSVLVPDSPTSLRVQLAGAYGGTPSPGSLQLHYSIDGGDYDSVAAVSLGGELCEAVLPAVDCRGRMRYYFTAEEAGGEVSRDPDGQEMYQAVGATEIVTSLGDDFETDLGWTAENLGASSGDWQRGAPVNDPGWTYDPIADGDGSGQCFLTGNIEGNTDVDGGAVRLTSPVFNMSQGGDIAYDYYLMLTDENGSVDRLLVEVSSDGGTGTWTEIARHVTSGGLSWRHVLITEEEIAAAGVTFTSDMRVRFTANDADPQSIVEAGIDGFSVTYPSCDEPGCCGRYTGGYTGSADCDMEGKLNLADITVLIDHVYISGQALCCPENGNTDGDAEGKVNLADITRLIDRVYITHSLTALCQ